MCVIDFINFTSSIFTFCFFFLLVSSCLGGKPITPNDVTDSLSNGHAVENGAVNESVTKTEVRHTQKKGSQSHLNNQCLFQFIS